LTFSEDKLILQYKNKHKNEISFAEVYHIYIKKHKTPPVIGLGGIFFLFFIIYMAMQYFSFEIVIIAAFLTIPLVLIRVIKYKWYRLNVRLKDGTFYSKRVAFHMNAENMYILDKVPSKYLYYNIRGLVSS
jgi:hypothetical protein